MSDFQTCIGWVLQNEDRGLTGRVTHDSGGLTKYGISQKAFPNVDIANLTVDGAKQIYFVNYWSTRAEALQSNLVAAKVLDLCVNCGNPTGVRLAQIAANSMATAGVPPLHEDGGLGPSTAAMLNSLDATALTQAICSAAGAHYQALAQSHPELRQYLNGWLNRARLLPTFSAPAVAAATGAQ